jgi:polar amino acid transport system substrate-binding protein
MKKFFFTLSIVISMWIGAGESFADELRVATFNYPPFQYEEQGEVKGIAVDIVRELFKRLNQPIKIDFYPFPRAVKNLKTGESDVIFTFYFKKEREAFADYTQEALVNQKISLFVHEDSPIVFDGDLSKLNQYKFGLVRFSYGSVFDAAVDKKLITRIEYVSKMDLNMKKFLRRRFDILPSDRWVAYYYYSKFNRENDNSVKLKELKPPIQSFPAYMGFSKANHLGGLRDRSDMVLKEMKKDGSYQRIIDGYLAGWGITGRP